MGFPVFKEFNPKQKGELWIKTSHRFLLWELRRRQPSRLFVESLAHSWVFEARQGACILEDLKSPRCFHNEPWLLGLGRHCPFLQWCSFTSCILIVCIYFESTNWDIHNKHVIICLVFLKSYITEYLGMENSRLSFTFQYTRRIILFTCSNFPKHQLFYLLMHR